MPSSKNALLRYKTIDRCLRNRQRRWTLQDLMDACEQALFEYGESGIGMASRRTIQMDLQFMRSEAGYAAPIIVGDRKYYTYEDPEFSILNAPVNIGGEDIRQLREAVGILEQLSGFSVVAGMEDIISRLQEHTEQMAASRKPAVYLEQNERLRGLGFIPVIHQAILDKKVLTIVYRSFKASRPRTYTFSPYLLREYRNRWFLFGRHTNANALLNFALDRMLSVEVSETADFIEDPEFDPDTYFDDIMGVTRNNEPVQTVRFRASAAEAPYILTKPLHRSQEVVEECPDGSKVFSLRVIINQELIRELMGFAEGIEVLSPHILVSIFKKKYQTGLDLYTADK